MFRSRLVRFALAAMGCGLIALMSEPALALGTGDLSFLDGYVCGPGASPMAFTAGNSISASTWSATVASGYTLTVVVTGTSSTATGQIKGGSKVLVNLPGTTSGSVTDASVLFTSTDLEDVGHTITVTMECAKTSAPSPSPEPTPTPSPTPGTTSSSPPGFGDAYQSVFGPTIFDQAEALAHFVLPCSPAWIAQTRGRIRELETIDTENAKNALARLLGQLAECEAAENLHPDVEECSYDAIKNLIDQINRKGEVHVELDVDPYTGALRATVSGVKWSSSAKSIVQTIVGHQMLPPIPDKLSNQTEVWLTFLKSCQVHAHFLYGEVGGQSNYAPRTSSAAARVPWPMSYADDFRTTRYRTTGPMSTASDTFTFLGGMPVNVWTRTKGAILAGGDGIGGTFTAGVVIGIAPKFELGVYGTGLGASIRRSSGVTKLTTGGGGLGLYATYRLPKGKLKLSGAEFWASHSVDASGASGKFSSELTKLSGGYTRTWLVGPAIQVTPTAIVTWQSFATSSYTDSTGTAISSAWLERFVLSAGITVARSFINGGPIVASFRPSLRVQGNVTVNQSTSSALPASAQSAFNASRETVDVIAGLNLALTGGTTVDFALGANGLAGDMTNYTGRLNVRLPLH